MSISDSKRGLTCQMLTGWLTLLYCQTVGFTKFVWFNVVKRPEGGYESFVRHIKRETRHKKIHSYFKARYV